MERAAAPGVPRIDTKTDAYHVRNVVLRKRSGSVRETNNHGDGDRKYNYSFLLFPQAVSDSAKEGLLMWFQIVLPSLLPFSIVSSVIMGLGLTERITGVVAPVLQRVFGITRSGCYAVVVGMLSGYPLGAATTAELYRGQRILQRRSTIYFNVL